MDKYLKVFLGLFVLAIIAVATYFIFKKPANNNSDYTSQTDTTSFNPAPAKGEVNYEEPDTTILVGSKEVYGGRYSNMGGGNIYLNEAGSLVEFPLNQEEIAVSCTNQTLQGITELDFDQVRSVHPVNPAELNTALSSGTYVVLFSTQVNDKYTVHSVAVNDSDCNF